MTEQNLFDAFLSARKRMLFSIVWLVAGSLFLSLIGNESSQGLVGTVVIVVPGMLFFGYYGIKLRALRRCPWCNKNLMHRPVNFTEKIFGEVRWLKRVNCPHCGMPR